MLLLDTALSYFLSPFSGGLLGLIWTVVLFFVLKAIWQNGAYSQSNKILWSLLVFFFPVGGVLIWYVFGK